MVENLPGMPKALGLIPSAHELGGEGGGECTSNSSNWEVEAGRSEVQDYPSFISNLKPLWSV